MTGDLLATVVAGARRSADLRERSVGEAIVRDADLQRPRGAAFRASLQGDGPRVIAECKRRSPSRGVLRAQYDPVAIARSYAHAGAAALSILTEPTFFDGSIDHLRAVRQAVDLPLLRKDFIVTEFQIVEACAAGADAVLLIAAALEDSALRELLHAARRFGLAALVEVHDRHEYDRARDAGAEIIGVNSRNLRTLTVSADVLTEMAPHLAPGTTAVAESGIRSADDILKLHALGYHAFLIGERFMTAADPGAALAGMLATQASAEAGS